MNLREILLAKIGLVWPMSMTYYFLRILLYRFEKKQWVFNFSSVKYAMEQRRLHEFGN